MAQQRTRLFRPTIILVGLSLVFLLPSAAAFYTDWLWFKEVGFEAVFAKRLRTSFLTAGVVFTVAFAGLWTNALVALSVLTQPYVVIASTAQGQPILFNRAQVRRAATIIATVAALAMALPASTRWLDLLEYRHAVPFGQVDPIFNRDVSFYVFQLPVYDFVRGIALAIVILSLVFAAGIYILAGAVGIGPRNRVDTTRRTRVHLSLLAVLLFIVMAAGAWLDTFRILVSSSGGIVHGGSYVDVHARLPFLYATTAVLGIGTILAVVHAFSRRVWPMLAAVGLYVVVTVAGALYAAIVQRVIVAPNEQVRELPFIERNIAATRRAFALDAVEERELPGDTLLTRADVAANAETLENVRLWDHQPLLDTFGQIQEIRSYYDFVSVDNDRYVVDGKYRQIMLSGRELNSDTLQNRSWVNERLTFTHGYGLTLGPVNQVTSEGLPVLFIKDIPPLSTADFQVREPSLYFGELASNYVLVGTRTKEFHHPKGDDNVYTEYSGSGGVPLGGFWRRLLFGLRFRSTDILLTDVLTADSRVLFHRRIRDRLGEIAPFIAYDEDPYLVIADGRLFWICDAYTMTGLYPYSTPARPGLNYIRNSVKVVVDAYDGTTTYYLADGQDPLVQTLARVFPTLFRPIAEMPAVLRRHVRYPEDIFAIQTAVFSTFHMTNPGVFYNKEDQWEVPAIESEGNPVLMQPYYTIMKLPGEKRAEFIQMLPFTPRRKDNLAAWMVARSDGDHYGKLLVFQFPKQKVVFGPRQIVARINQDQVISPQITLWNQQGSQVIQGTLLVIPIEQSLLYIRPLYLRASGGRIPELKRVIVAHQNQIVMEETLPAALNRIFGPGAARVERSPETLAGAVADSNVSQPPASPAEPGSASAAAPVPAGGESLDTLAGLAQEHYQRALQAQRDGNWALYGEEIKKLGDVLERMRTRK
ncbi:MAG TPA: UPF0182 family protein [Vicinamibacterales bacterium]|jgi:hypothetical protein|nr:UPF0182 family protein [Vicinamibacterales bacterium]